MSKNFRGITFAEQSVTPADDAIVRKAVLPDGFLSGCEISYSGSTLTMASGFLIACGRMFQHIAAENWAVVDQTSGFARLVLTVDLSQTSTEDTFNQITTNIEYASAENGFVQLEQSDINLSGSMYQIEVCVVSLGAGGITGIIKTIGTTSPFGAAYDLLWENASPDSKFAGQDISIDLSDYKEIRVHFIAKVGSSTSVWGWIPIGSSSTVFCSYYPSTGYTLVGRGVFCSTTEYVGFGKDLGKIFVSNDNVTTINGSAEYMIPIEIYGIK